jgi:DNA-binding Lrp family transcriptional regulator
VADGLSYAELYADLVAAAQQDDPPEQSFSVAAFADDTGMTHKQALDRLKALRASGAVQGEKFNVDGTRQWRFWFAERGD